MPKGPLLRGLPALLIVTVLLSGCDPGPSTTRDQELASLRKQCEELNVRMEQQTALLHRALGQAIAVRVPEETLRQLKELEERVEKQRPKSHDEAETLRRDTEKLVKTRVPPWTEDELLPRLNALRWNVQALWLLTLTVADDNAAAMAEDARSLLSATPDKADPGLSRELLQHRDRLAGRAQEHERKLRLEQAREALAGKGDVLAALGRLEGFDGDAVPEVRKLLRHRWHEQEAESKLGLLRTVLAAAGKLPGSSLRHGSLLKVQDAVSGLLLDLQSGEAPSAELVKQAQTLLEQCESQVHALNLQQAEIHECKLRDYQKWALEQILLFDGVWCYEAALPRIQAELNSFRKIDHDLADWPMASLFPSTKQLIQEKLGVDLSGLPEPGLPAGKAREIYSKAWSLRGWSRNIDEELAYRCTRDGMIALLGPINPALLDPPVAQLYQKAFHKGWTRLEGREDQLHVARLSAICKKKGLD